MKLEDFGVQRQETALSNGAKLVLFERKGAPLHIRASFFAGSRFDPVGKEGTAHFLEHMLVAGTKKFPTKDKLAAYIEQLGGGYGAFTTGDTVNLDLSIGDPGDVGYITDLTHEMLSEPLFDEKTLEAERGSILRELGDKKSNPGLMVREVWRKLCFQGTELGRSVLGSEESISSIAKADILKFYQEKILSGPMVFVASGGIGLSDLKKEMEGKVLLKKSISAPAFQDLPVLRSKPVSIEKYQGIDQVHLIFGFRSPSELHPDVPALDVLVTIFGRGLASVLRKELRYEKGLVYGVSAGQQTLSDSGAWVMRTSTSKNNVNEVLGIITTELKKVCEQGLSAEQVKFAQDKIEKSKRMEMQTSASWVNFHSFRELFGGKPWTLVDYVSEIKAVTPEMTREVAQKYFGPDKWYLAVCGDVEESEIKINW